MRSPSPFEDVAGIVLAGGLARRMGGGDKPLIAVDGATLLDRTVARLRQQAQPLLLNANGDPDRFAALGLEVRADVVPGFGGPLMGILTGLEWAREKGRDWAVTVAADTPLFPADLVQRLRTAVAAEEAEVAVACSGGRMHPVFTLWPVALAGELRTAVTHHGARKVEAFVTQFRAARVDWPTEPFDPFFNVNAPDDLEGLRTLLDRAR